MSLLESIADSPLNLFLSTAIVTAFLRMLYHASKGHPFFKSPQSIPTTITTLPHDNIIPSPESTLLPHLSPSEISKLPYPPSALPNGRWITTPYGRIRTYTIGNPTARRKVVFIHGISTPCISGRDIVLPLADKDCHILLFDLPGRGYSECPNDIPQDIDIFESLLKQLCDESFGRNAYPISLIGYSLGGCLAASFTSRNPQLVESLVVLSSPGLMRKSVLNLPTKMSMSNWVPDKIWEIIVSRQLKDAEKPPSQLPHEVKVNGDGWTPLDVDGIMRWQGKVHVGYLRAFVSSFRNAPIFDAVEDWKKLGEYLRGGTIGEKKKMLAVYGADDELTPATLLDTIKDVVGEDCVEGIVVEGVGHELPVYKPWKVVEAISRFWDL